MNAGRRPGRRHAWRRGAGGLRRGADVRGAADGERCDVCAGDGPGEPDHEDHK